MHSYNFNLKIKLSLFSFFLLLNSGLMAQNIDTAFRYYKASKFDRAALEFEKILPYLQRIYGLTDTTYYTYYLFYTADCFGKDHKYTRAEDYFLRAKEIYEKNNGSNNPNYLIAINKLAESYRLDGKFAEAERYYLLSLDICSARFGEAGPQYLTSLSNLATLYQKTGSYKKAEPLFMKSLAISQKLYGMDDPQIASDLNNIGAFYDDMGDYAKAGSFFLRALKIREKDPGPDSPEYAISANNLAELYFRTGRYEEAEALYLKALSVVRKAYGYESPACAISLNNLGALYQSEGNYNKAESYYLEAMAVRKKLFGEWHPGYATSLNNIALFYQETGNFEKAGPLYLQAMEIRKQALGEDHPDYGVVLNNLALFYSETGNQPKAESMYLQALDICRKVFGEDHINYAVSLNNLALFYSDRGDYQKAEAMLKQVLEIYRKTVGELHGSYAQTLNNLAEIYDETGRDKEAEDMYNEALSILNKAFGENHPDYSSTLCNLALFYQFRGRNGEAASAYYRAKDSYMAQIRQQFSFLSEEEKEKYLKRVLYFFRTYQSFILKQQANDPSLAGVAYDMELSAKGLLLNSDRQIRNFILNSDDSTAIRKYNSWLNLRATLSREYALPLSQQRGDLKQVEAGANDLEKQITRIYSQTSGQKELQNVHWQDVQKSLKGGEAAIEFSSFPYFNSEKWSDSTVYVALILKKGDPYPAMVTLFEGRQLDTLLRKNNRGEDDFINNLYNWPLYGDTSGMEKGEHLYNLVWRPLEKYLHGIRTIHFSASGRLYQLSFSALPCDETHLLSDRFRLDQLSSTAQLIERQRNAPVKKIDLYGGIDYDAGPSPGGESKQGGPFMYLDGTLSEVENIRKLAEHNRITSVVISGKEATEASIKNLNGKSGPDVIHIATHGFFFPDIRMNYNKSGLKASGKSNIAGFRSSDNPLMRSGLAFAGANHYWSGEKTPSRLDDGILTAYEVSDMYLPATQLVVLSACETGLGEIRGSEGVFGLQRSFRIAGAKNILMSLWQIPDYQTTELMGEFYRRWISGKPVGEAFRLAQNFMKKKYPRQPFMWAAFVLLK
jgi:CHAT domain-containing protein/tetratricopeptide (TPR) repeat protein